MNSPQLCAYETLDSVVPSTMIRAIKNCMVPSATKYFRLNLLIKFRGISEKCQEIVLKMLLESKAEG
jgi:hypothetical protein